MNSVTLDPFVQPTAIVASGFGPWFTSTEDVECDGCGINISPGDPLRADADAGYACMDCGKD